MLTIVLALLFAAVLLRVVMGHLRMLRVLKVPSAEAIAPPRYPSLTVIRPIKGVDVGYRENTEALLAQDYPGEIETLFVFDSPNDPAYPAVAEAVRASDRNARVLFAGPRPVRRTGKLHAMIAGFAQAHGELIAFCDSDSRPTPGLLRELVDDLMARPERGASFAPAVTMGDPSSFAEVVYGLMINSWYGAAAAELAGEKRELPFIMGQLMVLRRDALDAIGGLESAEGQLVDDMFLGARLAQFGYTNFMARSPLHLVTGPLGLRELSTLLHKWMTFSRSGLPRGFVLRNVARGLDLILALFGLTVSLAAGKLGLSVAFAVALGLWVSSQVSLYHRLTGAHVPLHFAFWVPLVTPFLAGALLVTSRLGASVQWRGESYQLNASARLQSEPRPPHATPEPRSSAAPAASGRSSMLPL